MGCGGGIWSGEWRAFPPAVVISLATIMAAAHRLGPWFMPLRRNVVEIILSIAALQKGLYTVVAASLLGSILSNLLLVLGKGMDGQWRADSMAVM